MLLNLYLLIFFIAGTWLESFQILKCHNHENKNIRKAEEDQFKARMSGCHGTMTGLKAVGQTGSRNELSGHRIPTYRDGIFVFIFSYLYMRWPAVPLDVSPDSSRRSEICEASGIGTEIRGTVQSRPTLIPGSSNMS